MTALPRHRRAGVPTWWASLAVRSAALPLPSEPRWRYRQEFLAELYGMTPSEQLHHATGVLSRAWALRIALAEAAYGTTWGTTGKDVRPLRCRLNLHTWRPYDSMADGHRYITCARCGKDTYRGNTISA
jgi:hypothetical protein